MVARGTPEKAPSSGMRVKGGSWGDFCCFFKRGCWNDKKNQIWLNKPSKTTGFHSPPHTHQNGVVWGRKPATRPVHVEDQRVYDLMVYLRVGSLRFCIVFQWGPILPFCVFYFNPRIFAFVSVWSSDHLKDWPLKCCIEAWEYFPINPSLFWSHYISILGASFSFHYLLFIPHSFIFISIQYFTRSIIYCFKLFYIL